MSSCTRRCSFRVAPIDENSSLLPPVGVWAVLNPSVADRPLRPATDRCPGRPLPHQLANRTQAHLVASCDFPSEEGYAVLSAISRWYPSPQGRYPRVPHPSATPLLLRAFDLHVLGTPPAFILSQDQTRHSVVVSRHPLPGANDRSQAKSQAPRLLLGSCSSQIRLLCLATRKLTGTVYALVCALSPSRCAPTGVRSDRHRSSSAFHISIVQGALAAE